MAIDLVTYVNRPVSLARLDGSNERGRFLVGSALRESAVLVPDDQPSRALAARLAEQEIVEISAAAPGGVALTRTRVVRWSAVSRMLTVVNPGALGVEQRRSSFRVETEVPVTLAVPAGGAVRVVAGTTINLSTGGLAARVDVDELPIGSELVVGLALDDGPLLAVGAVRAQHDPAHIDLRVEFTQITVPDHDRLASLVQQIAVGRVQPGKDSRGSTPAR
jgi:hypothetical protein